MRCCKVAPCHNVLNMQWKETGPDEVRTKNDCAREGEQQFTAVICYWRKTGEYVFPELAVFLILFVKLKNAALHSECFISAFHPKIRNINCTIVQMCMLSIPDCGWLRTGRRWDYLRQHKESNRRMDTLRSESSVIYASKQQWIDWWNRG
jgi:hypothetical protein